MPEETGFLMNYKNKYSIDTTGGSESPVWAPLAAGINNVEPDFADETDDTAYFDGEGFSNEDVTGLKASLSVSGHRKLGDAAQDYIAGLVFKVGEGRKTQLKWEQPGGKTITGSVTISNIKTTGGDANTKGTFEFTATFNGKPTVTPTP
ncbi:phage tail tube protein [Sutcliffiella halmapala]|uniref:phage tail tube protein n=1 Tax=Sutcliffiella halmapala TaxID=79882 RepID=UPI000994F756|nr:phage tail tube protein [Sutcliffiella halmapala]